MLFDYTDLDFTHNSVQIPTSPLLLFYPTHSFLNFRSVMRHSLLKSSQLAPHDFPLACLLQIALFIPKPEYSCKPWSAKDCILKDWCNK